MNLPETTKAPRGAPILALSQVKQLAYGIGHRLTPKARKRVLEIAEGGISYELMCALCWVRAELIEADDELEPDVAHRLQIQNVDTMRKIQALKQHGEIESARPIVNVTISIGDADDRDDLLTVG